MGEMEYPDTQDEKRVTFRQGYGTNVKWNPPQRELLAQITEWLKQNSHYAIDAIIFNSDYEYLYATVHAITAL